MKHDYQRSESFTAAALLALAGGFLDAYTYLCRGAVFANAQTGNMVLLALRAAEGNWAKAFHYLMPILAFSLGVLVAELIKRAHRHPGRIHWRHTVLAVEMAALVLASLAPVGEWDSLVNVTVSFVCALQVETFRKVRGYPFASTMCTGNLRSGTELLYQYFQTRDRGILRSSLRYYQVIVAFIAGAAVSAVLAGILSPRFPQGALLAPAVLQAAAFWWMFGSGGGAESKN